MGEAVADGSTVECAAYCVRACSSTLVPAIQRSVGKTYPFLSPSTCRFTHHIPGVPKIIHSAAFFPNEPIGSHAKTRKYASMKKRRIGTRTMKRKMWNGR